MDIKELRAEVRRVKAEGGDVGELRQQIRDLADERRMGRLEARGRKLKARRRVVPIVKAAEGDLPILSAETPDSLLPENDPSPKVNVSEGIRERLNRSIHEVKAKKPPAHKK